MAKCYIRLDEDKNIIKAFSIKFEQPESNDILIEDTPGRHFNNTLIPKGLIDSGGKFNYKYSNKKIVVIPETDKYTQQEKDDIEKEKLIQDEIKNMAREWAVTNLKEKNKLDNDGNLIKE